MRLMERVQHKIRFKQYSIKTEQSYMEWICRFSVLTDINIII